MKKSLLIKSLAATVSTSNARIDAAFKEAEAFTTAQSSGQSLEAAARIKVLEDALRFYADSEHFQMHDPDCWDTVSGEPMNFYEDDSNTATVEDGTVAKLALEGNPLADDEERTVASQPPAPQSASFQQRVQPWMMACFGLAISADTMERNHRFLEESLELVQSTGCTQSEAHQLVDYVFGRPVGEREQEVGGVMVTLAALCLAQGIDMHQCGETELARIWTKVEKIRAKQAAKPKHSPLPESVAAPQASAQPAPVAPSDADVERIGEVAALYADLLAKKYHADKARNIAQIFEYYIADAVRRSVADLYPATPPSQSSGHLEAAIMALEPTVKYGDPTLTNIFRKGFVAAKERAAALASQPPAPQASQDAGADLSQALELAFPISSFATRISTMASPWQPK